jgi:hypothetical protein
MLLPSLLPLPFKYPPLQVRLDDITPADTVAIGLCVMPDLTHLTFESNAFAIGVTGAVGLVTLTSLRELVMPSQAIGDQGLQVRRQGRGCHVTHGS